MRPEELTRILDNMVELPLTEGDILSPDDGFGIPCPAVRAEVDKLDRQAKHWYWRAWWYLRLRLLGLRDVLREGL